MRPVWFLFSALNRGDKSIHCPDMPFLPSDDHLLHGPVCAGPVEVGAGMGQLEMCLDIYVANCFLHLVTAVGSWHAQRLAAMRGGRTPWMVELDACRTLRNLIVLAEICIILRYMIVDTC